MTTPLIRNLEQQALLFLLNHASLAATGSTADRASALLSELSGQYEQVLHPADPMAPFNFTENPHEGDTFTVGAKTYTFKARINNSVPNEVAIGPTTDVTRKNALAAVHGDTALSGIGFSASTTANPDAPKIPAKVAATAVSPVNLIDNPEDGKTLLIGVKLYTFKLKIDNAIPNQILIGPDAAATKLNALAALRGDPTQLGTAFSSSTTSNALLNASEDLADAERLSKKGPDTTGGAPTVTKVV